MILCIFDTAPLGLCQIRALVMSPGIAKAQTSAVCQIDTA
jgi:hypothetical protein